MSSAGASAFGHVVQTIENFYTGITFYVRVGLIELLKFYRVEISLLNILSTNDNDVNKCVITFERFKNKSR